MNSLDLALYGQVLKGVGPWPEGPRAKVFKQYRRKVHDARYGVSKRCPNKPCPVCKPVRFNV